MIREVNAIYENGQLRLLEPIDLSEGQHVKVNIETLNEQEAIRAALGDLIRWADPQANPNEWVEAEAETIARELEGHPPLSQIIIEDRGEI